MVRSQVIRGSVKDRGGAKQLYGVRPTRVATRRRLCRIAAERLMRKSAPETSPCHVQAKQNGELHPRRVASSSPGAFPRNRDRDGTRDRRQGRIGSVGQQLCTWA